MKSLHGLLCLFIAVGTPCMALANTERPDQSDPPNPEIRTMAFDQCIEILHDYEHDLGPPQVILDTPDLRIVKFTSNSEQEQIACDGDGDIMAVLDTDEN
jgi:hypothetical protein